MEKKKWITEKDRWWQWPERMYCGVFGHKWKCAETVRLCTRCNKFQEQVEIKNSLENK